jgi:hypothetical protein
MADNSFNMDNAYRQTDEYKGFIEAIKKDAPWMPLPLMEGCIIAHKTDPQAYKKDKEAKKVMSKDIRPPQNKGEVVQKGKIQIGEVTDDILKQRQEFFEKHGISEEAEYIPKGTATIEEVVA